MIETRRYNKPPLSTNDQAELLIKRGLTGISKPELEKFLNNVNYYRIRGYTYCYQNPDSTFKQGTSWQLILDDYLHDTELRTLIFEALSFIEIGIRTQLEYRMSLAHGSRWYEDETLFHDKEMLANDLKELDGHWRRSREMFKTHYETRYDTSVSPPSWMIFETTTFGTVSKFFSNIDSSLSARNEIARYFGFGKYSAKVFVSWMRHLNLVRNICAHHSRLFSRSFIIKPMIPASRPDKWVSSWPAQDRLFPSACIIARLLEICAPDYDFKNRLKCAVRKFRKGQLASMGFPAEWENEVLFR
ncbi:MAG: Abi family protein [Treponemataceae bacterium]|nr:Abi family protein [Treponemataceae bacterium]